MYPNQYGNAGIQTPYLQNLQDVKSFFRKPIILMAAVLYSIQVIMNILSLATGSQIQQDVFQSFYFYYDLPAYSVQTMNTVSVITSVIMSAIPILIAVSFWIIYLKSRSRNPQASPSAGFTILYALSIVALVLISLIVVLFLAIILIAMGVGLTSYWEGQFAIAVILFLFIIVFSLLLLFVIAQLRFTSALRASARGPVLKSNGSIMFGVLYIIYGGILCLNMVNNLSTASILLRNYPGYEYKWEVILGLVNMVISVTIAILVAIICFSYNGYVKQKNMGYTAQQTAVFYPQGQGYYQPNGSYPQQAPNGNPQGTYQNPGYYGQPPVSQPNTYPVQPDSSAGYSSPVTGQPPETPEPPSAQQAQEPPVFTSPFDGAAEQPQSQEDAFGQTPAEQEPEQPKQGRACPVCGCSVKEDAAYCPQCGTALHPHS